MSELYHYGVKGMMWGKPGLMAKPVEKAPQRKASVSAADRKLVDDVIAGKYGNGEARRRALGSKYNLVQDMVNTRLVKGYHPRYRVTDSAGSAKKTGTTRQNGGTKKARKTGTKKRSRLSPQEKAARAKKTAARKALADKRRIERGKQKAKRAAERAKRKAEQIRKKKERITNFNKDSAKRYAYKQALGKSRLESKRKSLVTSVLNHSEEVEMGQDTLMHYGVKGMKWGIRHPRDWSDGGRVKNLKSKVSDLDTPTNRERIKKAYKAATTPENAQYKNMTDAELKTALGRMRLENEYRNLKTAEANFEKGTTLIGRGRNIVKALKDDDAASLQVNTEAIYKNHVLPEVNKRAKEKAREAGLI